MLKITKSKKVESKTGSIYLASDHAGYVLKEELKSYLFKEYDFDIVDCGAYKLIPNDDYTDYMHTCASNLSADIAEDVDSIAFVFGGSGEGEAMVMNRYAGVRCTTYYGGNLHIVELGRQHNNANSLSFGARFVDLEECLAAAHIFLSTRFEGGRHKDRVEGIEIK